MSETIDEIISKKAFSEIDSLAKKMNDLVGAFEKSAKAAKILDAALSGANTIAKIKKATDELADSQEELTKTTKKLKSASEQLAEAEARMIGKAAATIGHEKTGSYKALEAQMKLVILAYKKLNDVERESERGLNMAKRIADMNTQLKAIDANLGNHQRNVGNYASGWNAVGNSINQLTREMPAFANSLQTGFMAISNNIPALFDAIKGIKEQNAALRAEGKPTESVFKQLGTAIFSWGTALSIGVTLLTVYGKDLVEFIGTVFKGKEAIDAFVVKKKEMNEAFAAGIESTSKEIGHLNTLYTATQNQKISIDDRKKAIDELQKLYPSYFKNLSDEAIMAGDAADAYNEVNKALQNKAMYEAFSNQVGEVAKIMAPLQSELNALDEKLKGIKESNQIKTKEGYVVSIVSTESLVSEANIEEKRKRLLSQIRPLQKQMDEIAKNASKYVGSIGISDDAKDAKDEEREKRRQEKAAERARKASEKASKQALKDADEAAKKEHDRKVKEYEDALNLLEIYQRDNNEEEVTYQWKRYDLAEKFRNKWLKDDVEYQDKLSKHQQEASEKIQKIKQDEFNNLQDQRRKDADSELKAEIDAEDAKVALYEKNATIQVNALKNQYINGKISKEEYEKEITAIELRFGLQRLKIQLQVAKAKLSLSGLTPEQIAQFKKDIQTIESAIVDAEVKIKNASDSNNFAKKLEIINKIVKDGAEVLGNIGDAIFAREMANLDAKEKKSTAYWDNEKKRIEDSGLTAIEKEKELKRVETLRANEQKQIAKDKITAERKRAALQKGIDIASITTSTAVAVMAALGMKPYTPANIGFAISAGLVGASQLAKAIATPLPQYAKGRDGGGAELAIVGEAGTELLIKRDGTASLTPNRATITHLEAGEKVIPHNKLMQMIHNSAMVNLSDTKAITANDYANAYIQALEKNSGKIDKLIKVTENKNNNISISGNFEHYTKIKSILR
jgi:uncharacterized coiled-coil protein SlyX